MAETEPASKTTRLDAEVIAKLREQREPGDMSPNDVIRRVLGLPAKVRPGVDW